MKALTLAAITLYQRYISPYKGFRCAYGAHTGCASCSALGYRAIRRFGIVVGIGLLRERLVKCSVAHRRYGMPGNRNRQLAQSKQAGFCDVPCDIPCDASCLSGSADLGSSCGSCGDWPSSRKQSRDEFNWINIPPAASDGKRRKFP